MAQAIYKIFHFRYTADWYNLSADEKHAIEAKIDESRKAAGCEVLLMGACVSDEKWLGWGVEKYPSLEAVTQHMIGMFNIQWFKYIEAESSLGVELPQNLNPDLV
jgi:hypothetical protein